MSSTKADTGARLSPHPQPQDVQKICILCLPRSSEQTQQWFGAVHSLTFRFLLRVWVFAYVASGPTICSSVLHKRNWDRNLVFPVESRRSVSVFRWGNPAEVFNQVTESWWLCRCMKVSHYWVVSHTQKALVGGESDTIVFFRSKVNDGRGSVKPWALELTQQQLR